MTAGVVTGVPTIPTSCRARRANTTGVRIVAQGGAPSAWKEPFANDGNEGGHERSHREAVGQRSRNQIAEALYKRERPRDRPSSSNEKPGAECITGAACELRVR